MGSLSNIPGTLTLRPIAASLSNPTYGSITTGEFNPAFELFGNGEQGFWYDLTNMSTLYQDATGLTPVSADGDPIHLIKSSVNGVDPVRSYTSNFATVNGWNNLLGSGVAMSASGGWLVVDGSSVVSPVRCRRPINQGDVLPNRRIIVRYTAEEVSGTMEFLIRTKETGFAEYITVNTIQNGENVFVCAGRADTLDAQVLYLQVSPGSYAKIRDITYDLDASPDLFGYLGGRIGTYRVSGDKRWMQTDGLTDFAMCNFPLGASTGNRYYALASRPLSSIKYLFAGSHGNSSTQDVAVGEIVSTIGTFVSLRGDVSDRFDWPAMPKVLQIGADYSEEEAVIKLDASDIDGEIGTVSPTGYTTFFGNPNSQFSINPNPIYCAESEFYGAICSVGFIANATQFARVNNYYSRLLRPVTEINVFLVGGQSNCDGRAPSTEGPDWMVDSKRIVNVLSFNNTIIEGYSLRRIGPTGNGTCYVENDFSIDDFGFADIAHHEIAQEFENVVVCRVSQGGTPLVPISYSGGSWSADYDAIPDGTPKLLQLLETKYGLLVSYCAANNIALNLKAMFWHQGERDGQLGTSQSTYESGLEALIAKVRDFTGIADLPFISGTVPAASTAYSADVRAAMLAVAAADPDVWYRDNDGIGLNPDSLHFNGAGSIAFGEWAAETYLTNYET
jgi:hypothetical protein